MADIEKAGSTSSHIEEVPYGGPKYATRQHGPCDCGRASNLRVIANPTPLGVFSFACTTLILSLINAQARGVTEPNVVVAMALGTGGIAQFAAGMWEFVVGNAFGATAFSAYGTFWISWALIFVPGTGVLAAYSTPETATQTHNAIAFFLMSWFIFTVIMFMASLRLNLAISSLFFFLALTFMFLMIGEYAESVASTKAGGVFGILTSAIGFYVGGAGLITDKTSYFNLPVYDLPKRH